MSTDEALNRAIWDQRMAWKDPALLWFIGHLVTLGLI